MGLACLGQFACRRTLRSADRGRVPNVAAEKLIRIEAYSEVSLHLDYGYHMTFIKTTQSKQAFQWGIPFAPIVDLCPTYTT